MEKTPLKTAEQELLAWLDVGRAAIMSQTPGRLRRAIDALRVGYDVYWALFRRDKASQRSLERLDLEKGKGVEEVPEEKREGPDFVDALGLYDTGRKVNEAETRIYRLVCGHCKTFTMPSARWEVYIEYEVQPWCQSCSAYVAISHLETKL